MTRRARALLYMVPLRTDSAMVASGECDIMRIVKREIHKR